MTNYREAIEQAMEKMGEAVVITNAYHQEILDHLGAMEDDGEPDVDVMTEKIYGIESGDGETAEVLVIREIDEDGYIQTNTDVLATIISFEDHERLGFEA